MGAFFWRQQDGIHSLVARFFWQWEQLMTYMQFPVYWDNGEFWWENEIKQGYGATGQGWVFECHQEMALGGRGAGIYRWNLPYAYGDQYGGGLGSPKSF
jgi:hypothetical protein